MNIGIIGSAKQTFIVLRAIELLKKELSLEEEIKKAIEGLKKNKEL